MNIYKAIEGETTWFPHFKIGDIPQRLPSGITIKIRNEEVGFDIQGLVGAIPLANGDTLQIIPKIGSVNFLRLLFRAHGQLNDLEKEYSQFVQYSLDDEFNFYTMVASQLFISVGEILKRSAKKARVNRHRNGAFAIGQIEPVGTALNIACRKQEPVEFDVNEVTENIPENRVITEAIIRAWSQLKPDTQTSYSRIYIKWINRFNRSKQLQRDIETVNQSFAAKEYGGPRDYYRRTLMLSQIMLGSYGIGFGTNETIEGEAILLNTYDIFEKYLRNCITKEYSSKGFIVTKGGIGSISLYTDGSYELIPDIVIQKENQLVLICDAKYKKPDASDHYQMMTYLSSNGLKSGILLSPSFNSNELSIREYATTNNYIVREVYLPMTNLSITEEFLGSIVENFA